MMGMPFLEASAKDGQNVLKAFQIMAQIIREAATRRGEYMETVSGSKVQVGIPRVGVAVKLDQPEEEERGPGGKGKGKCCD